MRLILIIALTITQFSLFADGIKFFEGTWAEAVEAAKAEEKIIFIDAYAVWCGPCKKMARDVFTNKEVGDFYNKNFINVKLDMEKGEGLTFRKKYPVSAFPTLYFVDYTEKVVQKFVGALPVQDFLNAGRTAMGSVDRTEEFELAYNEGKRDPELIYNYVKALNQAGKPSSRVTNEYLRSQKKLNTPENLKIIFEGTVSADSWVFDKFIDHRKAIEKLFSKKAVENKIFDACKVTSDRAVEFKSEDLLKEAIAKAKKHVPSRGAAFTAAAEMNYTKATNDVDGYIKASKTMAKLLSPNSHKEYHKMSTNLVKYFGKNTKALKLAEQLAGQAANGEDNLGYCLTYSDLLYRNGKTDKAYEVALKAKSLAEQSDNRAVKNMVNDFIKQMEK